MPMSCQTAFCDDLIEEISRARAAGNIKEADELAAIVTRDGCTEGCAMHAYCKSRVVVTEERLAETG